MAKEKEIKMELVNSTEILGREINMYGSVEYPFFLAKDVAEWIDYSKNPNGSRQVNKMLKSIDDDEKLVVTMLLPGDKQARNHSFVTEDGLYEVCMLSRKPIAKQMKKEIKIYLHEIRLHGGVVAESKEELFVENYLGGLSEDTKIVVIQELHDNLERVINERNELKEFYDALLSTEGLRPMNVVAKELHIGVKKLYTFLRANDVMFYKGKVNIPYQRFMEHGLFQVKEIPARNGKYVPQTFATTKGVEYIRKMLSKKDFVAEQ